MYYNNKGNSYTLIKNNSLATSPFPFIFFIINIMIVVVTSGVMVTVTDAANVTGTCTEHVYQMLKTQQTIQSAK